MSNIAAIKTAAAGRWPEILSTLAGVDSSVLDGKHHPCPKCGGVDRFRALDDFADVGAVYCNQCFNEKNGDGIAALQWLRGIDFKTAVKMLSDFLGVAIKQPKKTSKSKLVQTYNYVDAAGKLRYQVCRFVPKDFRQRRPKSDGGWSWSLKGVERVPYHLDRIVKADKTQPIFIVEGERDANRLWAASAYAQSRMLATCNAGGAGKWEAAWQSYFTDRRVIVLPDNDQPGRDHAHDVTTKLFEAAESVKIVELPNLPEKGDVSDWLDGGHEIDELLAIAEAAPSITAEQVAEWSEKINSGNDTSRAKPDLEIVIGTDETRVVDEAIAALATCQDIYQRGGGLVQIVEGTDPPQGIARPKEAPRIGSARFARIRELLADAATWLRPTGDDEVEPIHPPDWVIKAIDARGQWDKIRRLEAVVESPVLRSDGTVLQTPGYDPLTGIIFRPQCPFPRIETRPTRDDAIRARDALLEIIQDFPFAADAHRAAWLAGVLTPLARYAFHGPAPLFLFDGNVRGCGKSLLTDVVSVITAGRAMARMSQPRDDDELRKKITALALAGEPLILIDNIAGQFGSASLDSALTATSWSDRILGQSMMTADVPLYSTWYATGNNVILAGDTARRVVHIRLESPLENPEERAGFHHADLLAWIREERSRLTAAAVTILSAYCATGRPDMGLKPWGSFEAWSGLVRSAVVWVGLPDPGSTRTELNTQADREAIALRRLILGWEEMDPSGNGMTVADVLRTLSQWGECYDMLREALFELAPPKDGKNLNARSVGMRLHYARRRVINGKFLDRRHNQDGSAVWAVFAAGTTGTTGTNLSPSRARVCAHAHGNSQSPEISPRSPLSPRTDPARCSHEWVDVRNGDGRTKRTCRLCGEFFGYLSSEVKKT